MLTWSRRKKQLGRRVLGVGGGRISDTMVLLLGVHSFGDSDACSVPTQIRYHGTREEESVMINVRSEKDVS